LGRGYQHLGENVTKQKKDWHEGIDYYKETTDEDNTRFDNKLGILLGTTDNSRLPPCAAALFSASADAWNAHAYTR
jgi:hypothetical protein